MTRTISDELDQAMGLVQQVKNRTSQDDVLGPNLAAHIVDLAQLSAM